MSHIVLPPKYVNNWTLHCWLTVVTNIFLMKWPPAPLSYMNNQWDAIMYPSIRLSSKHCLLIMGHLSPMYELHGHCVVDVQWIQTILDKMAVSPFNLWIITEMQWCTPTHVPHLLLIMGHLPPKYESHRQLVFYLQWLQTIFWWKDCMLL